MEWGLAGFKNKDHVITTVHKKEEVTAATALSRYSEKNMNYKVHSHPGVGAPKGASVSSSQQSDMRNIKAMANRFYNSGTYTPNNFPKHFIYHTESKNVYQYTPYIESINIGNINGKNGLNKIIKNNSYSSLHY